MKRVRVALTNRTATVDTNPVRYEKLRDFWSFYPPGYRYAPQHQMWLRAFLIEKKKAIRENREIELEKLPGWDGRIRLLSRYRLSAGLFRATYKEAEEKLGYTFEVYQDLPKVKPFKDATESTETYRYQDRCVDKMCSALHRGGGIVLASTGSGKTKTTSDFFKRIDYDCLFVVDELTLLYQTKKELRFWLKEKVGIVGEGKFIPRRITVATIQTLHLHREDPKFQKWFNKIKVVVVDELHEQMAKRNFSLLEKINPIARYGLTATLQLKKKDVRMRAYSFAGPVIFEFPLAEGIKKGVLSDGKVIQLIFPEIDQIEDYHEEYLSNVVLNGTKLDVAVRLVRELIRRNRYVIVLVDRVRHIEILTRAFESEQFPFQVAYGSISKNKRVEAKENFETGDIRLIIANKVFKKGTNIKRVDVILDLAEMKSKNDAIQKFGRGVRLHPDKDGLIYVDFGTDTGRFGTAARSRASAFKQAKIHVTKVNVTAVNPVKAVLREIPQTQLKLQLD